MKMNRTKLKRWPADCVQIIAATKAEARVPAGEGIRVEHCADCGAELAASQETFFAAIGDPDRAGRPLRYVCLDCATQYDARSMQKLCDFSGGRNVIYRGEGGRGLGIQISRRPRR
jgi:hypothetical protein